MSDPPVVECVDLEGQPGTSVGDRGGVERLVCELGQAELRQTGCHGGKDGTRPSVRDDSGRMGQDCDLRCVSGDRDVLRLRPERVGVASRADRGEHPDLKRRDRLDHGSQRPLVWQLGAEGRVDEWATVVGHGLKGLIARGA